jgi:hypothetical protein
MPALFRARLTVFTIAHPLHRPVTRAGMGNGWPAVRTLAEEVGFGRVRHKNISPN